MSESTTDAMTTMKKTPKGWTATVALGLVLLASCGGGGGGAATPTAESGSQSPSSQWTYSSGYVHLVGHWAPKDTNLSPYTLHQAAYKKLHQTCNAVRALVNAPPQPELPDDKQALLNRVDTWYYYKQTTSAARMQVHGPTGYDLVDLTRFNREFDAAGGSLQAGVAPPDCLKVEAKLGKSATLWTPDDKRYAIDYNAAGQVTQVNAVNVAAPEPRLTAPPQGTQPIEINVGGSIEKCYPWWGVSGVPANIGNCMWDRYANVVFRNLPMPLRSQVELGADRLVNEAVEVSPTIPAAAGPWGPEPFDQVPTVQAPP